MRWTCVDRIESERHRYVTGKKGQEDTGTKAGTGVTLDKFNIFHLRRRPKSDPGTGPIAKHAAAQQMGPAANGGAAASGADETLKKKKSRFVKSASIARIFGNTYNTKKYDDSSALLKLQQFKRSFLNSEKFHKKDSGAGAAEEADDGELQIGDACYVNDSESSAKAIKSITRGLGRLLRRNCHSIDISRPDPEYKVSYLGNVLTGWAKGYRNNYTLSHRSTLMKHLMKTHCLTLRNVNDAARTRDSRERVGRHSSWPQLPHRHTLARAVLRFPRQHDHSTIGTDCF
uniref:Uncharacterized protein n=1 Tax=Anopheles coluzzii TaxID=1518534 RepID=A0A8W7PRJ2_ANOCL